MNCLANVRGFFIVVDYLYICSYLKVNNMADEKIYTLEELQKKLTDKERNFCREYIIDWNGARSARKAGYSENSAREIATQNLSKLHIKQYIEFIKDDIAKEAQISKLSLINELKLIAFSNLPIIIEKYREGGVKALTEEEQKVISEYTENKKTLGSEDGEVLDSHFKLKTYDKRGAIQDIMKAMGWNEPDKVDHTTNGESLNDVSKLTTEELILRAKALKDINDKT